VTAHGVELARARDFVDRETRLLDERRWDDWNRLFTEDGLYWVPLSPSQPDPWTGASIFLEDAVTRELRSRRFRHPNLFSQQPLSRTLHWVANVTVDTTDAIAWQLRVNAAFTMIEYRRERQFVYGGTYRYELSTADDDWRIRSKRVDLVNCDAPLESIHVYL
jgi:benzoate/toluate 1,2-dioxygenase beta subunit